MLSYIWQSHQNLIFLDLLCFLLREWRSDITRFEVHVLWCFYKSQSRQLLRSSIYDFKQLLDDQWYCSFHLRHKGHLNTNLNRSSFEYWKRSVSKKKIQIEWICLCVYCLAWIPVETDLIYWILQTRELNITGQFGRNLKTRDLTPLSLLIKWPKSAGHKFKFDAFHSKRCLDMSEGRDNNKQTNKRTNIKLIQRV